MSKNSKPRAFVMLSLSVALWMSAPAHAVSTHIATAIKAAADAPATLTIARGDNVREIAQGYAKAHNVPFNKVLPKLLSTNEGAFIKGDPDNLTIGAAFVLPAPSSFGVRSPLGATKVEAAIVKTVVEEPTPLVQPKTALDAAVVAAPIVVSDASVRSNGVDEWLASPDFLAVFGGTVAALLGLTALWRNKRRKARQNHAVLGEVDETIDEQTPIAPTETSFETPLMPVQPLAAVEDVGLNDTKNDTQAHYADENAENVSYTARFDKVQYNFLNSTQLNGASIDAHDAAQMSLLKTAQKLDRPHKAPRFADIDVPDVALEPHLNVLDEPVAAAIKPTIVAVAPVTMQPSSTRDDGLALDIDGFLQKFVRPVSHVTPLKRSVDFDGLTDRTRLQAWLNQHTPEEILETAIDAHEQEYDNIAQVMLTEVLFRGDAEQCGVALKLRTAWIEHEKHEV